MPCERITESLLKVLAGVEEGEEELKDCRSFLREEVTDIKDRLSLAKASIKEAHALPTALRKYNVDQADLVKLALYELSRRGQAIALAGREMKGEKLIAKAYGTEGSFVVVAYCPDCEGERQGALKDSVGYFVQMGKYVIAEVLHGETRKVLEELERLVV
ncbi:MAG: hypothetical protein ACP5HQ_07070 [Thermoprotei archaeon]